jgi:sugar/nucleoside kinase (ribokinase family)
LSQSEILSTESDLLKVQQDLKSHLDKPSNIGRGVLGFDGFIDSMIRFKNPESMSDFGPAVEKAAGIATSAVVEHQGQRMGGNGPLLASALGSLGKDLGEVHYFGALGLPEIHPLYLEDFQPKVTTMSSFANPSRSDCLEFTDGKIMLSDFKPGEAITWENLLKEIGEEKVSSFLRQADFMAALNWGKVPYATDLWIQSVKKWTSLTGDHDRLFFMDLAEFSTSPDEDKKRLPQMINEVAPLTRSVLSLNLKEGWQFAALYGLDYFDQKEPEAVSACAKAIRDASGLDRVIIHPNQGASMAHSEGEVWVQGPHCSDPLISTGAGDHFGAGILFGLLQGLNPATSLLLGNATSGYYVRSGQSPSPNNLRHLLELWESKTLGERLSH